MEVTFTGYFYDTLQSIELFIKQLKVSENRITYQKSVKYPFFNLVSINHPNEIYY